ncbi:MAG: SPOR domain-containing protein [Bacteroidota bacterium]
MNKIENRQPTGIMNIRNLCLLLIALSFSLSSVQAQEMSWRKHRKLALQLEKEGDYFAAAENFRMAWEKKQSKEDLIYKAAENYYRLSDYRNAAEAYQHVPANFNSDALITLKYARALKQDGQYDKARTVFQEVADSYTGPDRAILQDIVRVEIQGIDISRDISANLDRRMEILHPGVAINSDSDEFGPMPVAEDMIWLTSTTGDQARIYETQRQGRDWTKAANPAGFPVVDGGQYANGSMSPDNQRFYFTICNNDGGWKGFNTRCEIYVTKRSANGWTAPERLPDYINVKGVNSTHPAVAHTNGQEYLYFASNREGGRGGLDLWYVTRDLGVDNMDYTFPVNLGPGVNSLGDEITPYYNSEEGVLYFASNGHPSIGGLDIFKSQGGEVSWSTPENLGMPLNSAANDYGYVRNSFGFGGFFASNRVFGGEKTNTRNDDIFEFSVGGRQITLKANVYDQATGSLLNNISVSLYQIFDDGSENLLINKDFSAGSYLFELLPNRRFRVEIQRSGYQPAGYVFATDDPATVAYGQPLFLQAETGTVVDPSTTTDGGGLMSEVETDTGETTTTAPGLPPTNSGVPLGDIGESYTARGTSSKDNLEYESSAPRFEGTYYRVQLAALGKYDPGNSKFSNLPDYGNVVTEYIPTRSLTRVLVGPYFNESEATYALGELRKLFANAYVVRYEDGIRYGRINF